MKEKHFVLVDKAGRYLAKFENQPGAFAYRASMTDEITSALSIPFDGADETQVYMKFKAFEKLFDVEVVIADIDVKLTRLDGTPFTIEPEDTEDVLKEFLQTLMRQADE